MNMTKPEIQAEANKIAMQLGSFLLNALLKNKDVRDLTARFIQLEQDWQDLTRQEEEFAAFVAARKTAEQPATEPSKPEAEQAPPAGAEEPLSGIAQHLADSIKAESVLAWDPASEDEPSEAINQVLNQGYGYSALIERDARKANQTVEQFINNTLEHGHGPNNPGNNGSQAPRKKAK